MKSLQIYKGMYPFRFLISNLAFLYLLNLTAEEYPTFIV